MTRRRLLRPLAAVAIAAPALLAGWWLVSDTAQGPPPGPAILVEQGESTLRSGAIVGMEIHASATDTVGRVEDLLVDTDGRVRGAVVSVGGVLGLGAKEVAIAWDAIEVKPQGELALLSIEPEAVRAAPPFRDRETLAAERLADEDEDRERDG